MMRLMPSWILYLSESAEELNPVVLDAYRQEYAARQYVAEPEVEYDEGTVVVHQKSCHTGAGRSAARVTGNDGKKDGHGHWRCLRLD